MSKTAAEFLTERRDFLYVYVSKSTGDPRGWDVVCRLDGTYSTSKAEAEAMAEGIREMMAHLSDVPNEGRHWWHGAPWRATEFCGQGRCGQFDHPCIHHGSLHCLRCCVEAGQRRAVPMSGS